MGNSPCVRLPSLSECDAKLGALRVRMYCAKLLVATAKQRLAFCEQSVATLAKEQRLARREWWVVVKLASAALLPGPSLSPPAGAVPGLSLSPPATSQQGGRLAR